MLFELFFSKVLSSFIYIFTIYIFIYIKSILFSTVLGISTEDNFACSLNCAKFSQRDFADLALTACAEFLGEYLQYIIKDIF